VLNLVVVVDRDWKGEIANRLSRVGRYHASRTVLCAVEDGRTTLDAWAAMSYSEPNSGLGVMHDSIEIDLGPEHLQRLDTIIDPVIISELPTMLWSPHGHEDAVDTLRRMVDVALRDTDDGGDPAEGLARANELLADSYVVDLAYLRTTPWRERLASAFDPPRRRQALHRVSAVTIRHHSGSTASALLLAGWLASRLGWEPSRLEPAGRDRLAGTARAGSRSVRVVLAPTDQDVPGLSGVTVTSERDLSLSLDRAQGGLKAREVRGEKEREWRILGASRGEGGILGEGVRQAHLRDPTYGPALSAAREFCPG
jgi:glucose-6-phosphate dehydrogenase assembly protein OpcA